MHSGKHDELYFATQYVASLRDDIKAVVEPQVPITVDRAALIAKIQQKVSDCSKLKFQRNNQDNKPQPQKPEAKPTATYGNFWRKRQLRDYRKANNLCFHCGEKFEMGHAEHCAKRNNPRVNALIVNDLDKDINEDLLNDMAIEDMIIEDFCQLSLNAMADTHTADSIQLKATVQNKTMLILVDTRSSHSFVRSHFVQIAKLPTVPIPK
jgi:hypothetical protein